MTLSANFFRLSSRVSDSLTETSQLQSERLGSVTSALTSLSEKTEKTQEGLRTAVENRLETIRSDNATKLEQMRATVDKPAFFHGGMGEDVFQSQLDQILVERISDASAATFSDPMYQLLLARRS